MISTEKIYLRDGCALGPDKQVSSWTISAIDVNSTTIELFLRGALYQLSTKVAYDLNWKQIKARMDINYTGKQGAYFMHSYLYRPCKISKSPTLKAIITFCSMKYVKNLYGDQRTRLISRT